MANTLSKELREPLISQPTTQRTSFLQTAKKLATKLVGYERDPFGYDNISPRHPSQLQPEQRRASSPRRHNRHHRQMNTKMAVAQDGVEKERVCHHRSSRRHEVELSDRVTDSKGKPEPEVLLIEPEVEVRAYRHRCRAKDASQMMHGADVSGGRSKPKVGSERTRRHRSICPAVSAAGGSSPIMKPRRRRFSSQAPLDSYRGDATRAGGFGRRNEESATLSGSESSETFKRRWLAVDVRPKEDDACWGFYDVESVSDYNEKPLPSTQRKHRLLDIAEIGRDPPNRSGIKVSSVSNPRISKVGDKYKIRGTISDSTICSSNLATKDARAADRKTRHDLYSLHATEDLSRMEISEIGHRLVDRLEPTTTKSYGYMASTISSRNNSASSTCKVEDNFGLEKNAIISSSKPKKHTSGSSAKKCSSGSIAEEIGYGSETIKITYGPETTEGVSGSKIKENSSGTKMKENISGTKMKENSSGSKIKENTSGTKMKENSSGTKMKENSSGTKIKENTSGTKMKENTSGTKMEENTSRTKMKDNNSGTKLKNTIKEITPGSKLKIISSGSCPKAMDNICGSKIKEHTHDNKTQATFFESNAKSSNIGCHDNASAALPKAIVPNLRGGPDIPVRSKRESSTTSRKKIESGSRTAESTDSPTIPKKRDTRRTTHSDSDKQRARVERTLNVTFDCDTDLDSTFDCDTDYDSTFDQKDYKVRHRSPTPSATGKLNRSAIPITSRTSEPPRSKIAVFKWPQMCADDGVTCTSPSCKESTKGAQVEPLDGIERRRRQLANRDVGASKTGTRMACGDSEMLAAFSGHDDGQSAATHAGNNFANSEKSKYYSKVSRPPSPPEIAESDLNCTMTPETDCKHRTKKYGYRMADSVSKMADSVSKMADSDSKMADSDSKMADSDSKMADSDSKMADSDSKMAIFNSKMATFDSKMATFDSKMEVSDSRKLRSVSKLPTAVKSKANSVIATKLSGNTKTVKR